MSEKVVNTCTHCCTLCVSLTHQHTQHFSIHNTHTTLFLSLTHVHPPPLSLSFSLSPSLSLSLSLSHTHTHTHTHTERVITELNIPGVQLALLKRPYDTRLDLTVQDLCLVDRLQTFGPEFELMVCSDGRNILRSFSPGMRSSFELLPMAMAGSMGKSFSCPTFGKPAPSPVTTTPIGANRSEIPVSPRDKYVVFSPESEASSLLSVSYQHISCFSPDHPAVRDMEGQDGGEREGEGGREREREGDGEGMGEEGEEFGFPGDGEPDIHKVSVYCTAIDVMGTYSACTCTMYMHTCTVYTMYNVMYSMWMHVLCVTLYMHMPLPFSVSLILLLSHLFSISLP